MTENLKGGIYLDVKGKKIGFVLTGSFCTFQKVLPKMKELIKKEAEIVPIMSFNSYQLDTKFGKAEDFINEISPNIESIINTARRNGKKAFKDTDDFKRWLIANQEGYNKFNFEIYEYFVHKFNL